MSVPELKHFGHWQLAGSRLLHVMRGVQVDLETCPPDSLAFTRLFDLFGRAHYFSRADMEDLERALAATRTAEGD